MCTRKLSRTGKGRKSSGDRPPTILWTQWIETLLNSTLKKMMQIPITSRLVIKAVSLLKFQSKSHQLRKTSLFQGKILQDQRKRAPIKLKKERMQFSINNSHNSKTNMHKFDNYYNILIRLAYI